MSKLAIVYSAILHGFVGYVWIVLIEELLSLYKASGKSVWAMIVVGVATILFLDLATRVFDSIEKDKKHPTRIAGYIALGSVVILYLILSEK